MRTYNHHERRMRAAQRDTLELLREIHATDTAAARETAKVLVEVLHECPLAVALKALAYVAAVKIYTEAGKGTDDDYVEAMTLLVSLYFDALWRGTGEAQPAAGSA